MADKNYDVSKRLSEAQLDMTDPMNQIAAAIFSETKDLEDAINIAWVIKNRMKNRKYGDGSLEGVIYKPYQFSGIGTPEWEKTLNGKLTPKEQKIFNQIKDISGKVYENALPDQTMGATHYFNPKLVKPKWSKNMTQTYKNAYHEYYRE